MGNTLVDGGRTTFRAVGSPRIRGLFNGIFHGTARIGESDHLLLFRDANGCWSELAVEAPAGDL